MKKAPDKIYLREFGDSLSQVWSGIKPPEGTNIASHEYIRKDALMEWIQEARTIPHENAITRDLAFQEIVNKLNSI